MTLVQTPHFEKHLLVISLMVPSQAAQASWDEMGFSLQSQVQIPDSLLRAVEL